MDLPVWCLLLLLINTIIAEDECFKGLKTPGYTYPKGDIIIEYGTPLDITCLLYENESYKYGENPSQDMLFIRKNERIPADMIEIINSTSIKLHIDNPPKMAGENFYCFVGNVSVCMNIVTVAVRPQDVTDFNCVSNNYDNLTCTWTPPHNLIRTNYVLSFQLKSRRAAAPYQCPKIVQEPNGQLSCTWTPSSDPIYRQVHDDWSFTLNMTNRFGSNIMHKPFKHYAHVLSGPPENLTLVSRTPSSLYFTWVVPLSMQTFTPGVHNRILYQCFYGDKKWKFGGLITTSIHNRTFGYNLTNLPHPHELCDIRVSIRSAVAFKNDESMWSKNASLNEYTVSAPPDRPPLTTIGAYHVQSLNSMTICNIFLYWQQLPDEDKNGDNFRYEVYIDGEPATKPEKSLGSYAILPNLSMSKAYTFRIWSVNNLGKSKEHAVISVPKQDDRRTGVKEPLSFTKMEFLNGTYELSWEPPVQDGHVITNYTLFWCRSDRDRPYPCTGQLGWKFVPGNVSTHRVTLLNNTLYQFAISTNTINSSSGMLWAACTIIHNQVVGKMKNVWINRLSSTDIEVGWKLECSDRFGRVKGFTIYYCPIRSPTQTACKEPEKSARFPGTYLKGRVTNLTPYTTYKLTVAMESAHEGYSPQSDPLFNTTFEAAPSSPPLNLQIVEVTNSSISLKWDPPTAMNGVLKNYVLQFNNMSRNVEQTSYTWHDLDSYVNYSISISACTIICSNKSEVINVTTKMGYPSKIEQPKTAFQNSSSIEVVWWRPENPRGRNDYYQVKMIEKFETENVTVPVFNVTERRTFLQNCIERKSNAFFVSVRAVNIIDNTSYIGPWSDELQYYCSTGTYLLYMFLGLGIVFFVGIAVLFNKLYKYCKVMRDVEVKLPPGLAPVLTERAVWSPETHGRDVDRDSHSPAADEELLLVKMSETRQLSGDSSGCSSGHESVTSSIESGTHISSTSDSGTEQTGGGNGGNYCVLGVDPIPVVADTKLPAYAQAPQTSPYVLSSEPAKSINPGYIPFSQGEPVKSTGYVVAGIKNGYIPFNQTESVNKNTGYVVAGIKNCKLD